jgi:PilZ domain
VSNFGKRIDGPPGRRRAARRPVAIVGSAVTLDGSKSVIVEDLCPTGAKLIGRHLPEPGTEVLLRTSELAVLGQVAWARHDERGVVFVEQDAPSAAMCLAMQMRSGS